MLNLGTTRQADEIQVKFHHSDLALVISGSTFNIKEELKARGAEWNQIEKNWKLEIADDDNEFKSAIEFLLSFGKPVYTNSEDLYDWYNDVK